MNFSDFVLHSVLSLLVQKLPLIRLTQGTLTPDQSWLGAQLYLMALHKDSRCQKMLVSGNREIQVRILPKTCLPQINVLTESFLSLYKHHCRFRRIFCVSGVSDKRIRIFPELNSIDFCSVICCDTETEFARYYNRQQILTSKFSPEKVIESGAAKFLSGGEK